MYGKSKGQSYYKNRHSCFLLQYHMVLVTKYRHPVLTRSEGSRLSDDQGYL